MTVLLLAGTRDARQIAQQFHTLKIPAIASLAGETDDPAKLPIPTVSGGFGGEAGFVEFLQRNNIGMVVDATHPFASKITERTFAICQALALPFVRFERGRWSPETHENWRYFDTISDAALACREGTSVFIATGRKTFSDFGELRGCKVFARQIEHPQKPFPFANWYILTARPPYSLDEERRVLRENGIDILVAKDSGGVDGASKLIAARELGVEVFLISRPNQPNEIESVSSYSQVIAWVEQHYK